jgi:hypothetical protein
MKQHECTATKKEIQKQRLKQWRIDNPEKRKAQRVREYQNSAEKLKAYAAEQRLNNPEKTREACRNSYAKTSVEVLRARRKSNYDNNPLIKECKLSDMSLRHKRIRQSMPEWAKEEVKTIYAEARRMSRELNIQYSVDHIYPLNGETISGLTVPSNLRVIKSSDNSRKSNKMVEDIV